MDSSAQDLIDVLKATRCLLTYYPFYSRIWGSDLVPQGFHCAHSKILGALTREQSLHQIRNLRNPTFLRRPPYFHHSNANHYRANILKTHPFLRQPMDLEGVNALKYFGLVSIV